MPLHVLRRSGARAPLEEDEIEHEVQRRDGNHNQADSDADRSAVMDIGDATAEETRADGHQINEPDGSRGSRDSASDLAAGANDNHATREQHRPQRPCHPSGGGNAIPGSRA